MSVRVLTQGGGAGGNAASIFVTGLDESSTVKTSNGKKTIDGVWGPPQYANSKLPDEYTRLEYIEATGTQHIDTGFNPNQDTRIVIDLESFAETNRPRAWFGARKEQSTGRTSIYLGNNSSENYSVYGHYGLDAGLSFSFTKDQHNARRTIDFNKNVVTFSTGESYTFPAQTFQVEIPLYLFTMNDPDHADYDKHCEMRVYSCKIYDNGTLIRDYVPAKRNDGEVGLYDTASGVFYTNAGTGAFIAGEFSYGFSLFPIVEYGLWTVTAINGGKSVEQDVLVDAAVAFEIEMSFGVTIYSHGTFEIPCTHVSSGSLLYATLESDHIRCYCNFSNYNSQSFAGYRSTDKINVTKFKKLKLEVYVDTAYADYLHFAYGVSTVSPTYGNWGSGSKVTVVGYGAPEYLGKTSVLEIDLSDLSGEYYPMLGLSCYTQKAVESVRIYEWWLE